MRPIRPLHAIVATVSLAVMLLAAPVAAGGEATPNVREATRSVVHAGPVDSSQRRPTSFDGWPSSTSTPPSR